MIVEVIAVGTELLIGQIVNTNGSTIGARLADEGFDAHYQVTVGDNLGRLTGAITTALSRADAVILTGGIGPTQDDLTREAICAATGRQMARDEEYAEKIRQRILARRGSIADSVLRMADYPEGADPLPNSQGVALGIALQHEGKWIFAVPGVPREMRALLDEEIMPRLREASGIPTAIKSRVLHTWGYGESQIAEILDDLYESTNPSIAFLISDMEVRVRITAKAESDAESEALIAPIEAEVRRRLGDLVFATDDETNLDVIARSLSDRGWTVGVCEAATAGQVGARLAAGIPAALAGATTLTGEPGSASELADRARTGFAADVGVGVSSAEVVDDAGHLASVVTFVVATPDGTRERRMRLFGTGERAVSYAVGAALHLLRLGVQGRWWDDSDR
jgi:nicotinamide-nucleotide amidase